uniref:Uncharacterized protein n=1 Tax=Gongylonema pulchrum TaxID=637853 RepID=A0A183DL55_9BILA
LDQTYRALTCATVPVPLKPVNESALARRRRLMRAKSISRDDDIEEEASSAELSGESAVVAAS